MGKISTTSNMKVFVNNMLFSATRPTPPDDELLSLFKYGGNYLRITVVPCIECLIDVLHEKNKLVKLNPIYEFAFQNDLEGLCEFACNHEGAVFEYLGEGKSSHNYSWFRNAPEELHNATNQFDYVIDPSSMILYQTEE